MVSDLYTEGDVQNLSVENLRVLRLRMNEEKPLEARVLAKDFNKDYVASNLGEFILRPATFRVLYENVFATTGAVRWYRFGYSDVFTRDDLVSGFRGLEAYGRCLFKAQLSDLCSDSIIGVSEDNNIFTLKILLDEGIRRVSDGIKSVEENVFRTVIVLVDCDNNWIEIRGNEKVAFKTVNILKRFMGLEFEHKIEVLNKYESIDDFKNDLSEGFLLDSSSIPSQDIRLSEEDGVMIENTFKAIDNYFADKNVGELSKRLDKINFGAGISFREIMLAGLSTFNIKVRPDSKKDISGQAFYTIFKEFLIQDSSFINFARNNKKYTIHVGVNSNSITFRSKPTEDVIRYIRNKVV
ncbi:MAG: hypothetical protein ACRC30_15960 [Clostridium sp.]